MTASSPGQLKGKFVRRSHGKGYLLETKVLVSCLDLEQQMSSERKGSMDSVGASPSQQEHRRLSLHAAATSSSNGGNVGEGLWREKMIGWQRATFVTIINNSDATMELESAELGSGSVWTSRPGATVGPMSRETFAGFCRGVSGTTGTVMWGIQGSEQRVLLIWENPHFGPLMKQVNVPEQFALVVKVSPERACMGIIVEISRKKEGGSLLLNDDIEDMDWAIVANASEAKVKDSDNSLAIRMLSMACSLLPPPLGPSLGDPLRRAQQLAIALKDSSYSVICLQEVFWGTARQLIRAALAPTHPYIIDRAGKEAYGVGVDAGLFVASKTPIEYHQFFPFEEGIGSDSLAHKGVMMVKLKVANMYIAVSDVQSDPDGSIPWTLQGNSKVRAAQVRQGQIEMIGRMINQTIGEREQHPDTCSLVLTGKLYFAAERRVRDEQEQWASSTLIPHLADLMNGGKLPVIYAGELLHELKSRGFQMRFLGKLRASTTNQRSRSLLLIIMVGRVLQQELWQIMRKEVFASKIDEHRRYVELGLRYYYEICKETESSTPLSSSALRTKPKSSEIEEGKSSPPPIPERQVLLFDGIWGKELHRKILANFGSDSLLDGVETTGSFLKAEILWFQMLRYMQELLGVILGNDVEIELLNSGPRVLEYPNDVEAANPDVLQGSADDWEADQKLQIEQTEEFRSALKTLGNPIDVFRNVNPNDFGADFTPNVRQMLAYDEKRTQHLLTFSKVPSQVPGKGKEGSSLLNLTALQCSRLRLMGDSGAVTDFLSCAPGVEAVLMPRAVDDFTLM